MFIWCAGGWTCPTKATQSLLKMVELLLLICMQSEFGVKFRFTGLWPFVNTWPLRTLWTDHVDLKWTLWTTSGPLGPGRAMWTIRRWMDLQWTFRGPSEDLQWTMRSQAWNQTDSVSLCHAPLMCWPTSRFWLAFQTKYPTQRGVMDTPWWSVKVPLSNHLCTLYLLKYFSRANCQMERGCLGQHCFSRDSHNKPPCYIIHNVLLIPFQTKISIKMNSQVPSKL